MREEVEVKIRVFLTWTLEEDKCKFQDAAALLSRK
jgi:hypothetical protein